MDYDSFTEDEDEDPSNAVSSSHIETTETKCSLRKINDGDLQSKDTMNTIVGDTRNDNLDTKVTNESKVRTNETKHFVTKIEDEDMNLNKTSIGIAEDKKNDNSNIKVTNEFKIKTNRVESRPKKLNRTDVDIDSIFAAHSSYGKHGFGFGWREQSDAENEVAIPSRQERKSYRSQMKSVSFVKSDLVLDLGELNEASNSEANSCEIADDVIPVNEDSVCLKENEEKCDSETTEELSLVKDSKIPTTEESVVSSENVSPEQEHDDVDTNRNEDSAVESCQPKTESREDLEVSPSSSSPSFELTDDLDEIDRVLCEALYKKVSFFL